MLISAGKATLKGCIEDEAKMGYIQKGIKE